MKKEAVLHVPLSEYAYAVDERTINIRIRTAKSDIVKCSVFYGDRVDMVEPIRVREVIMDRIASDELFDYYEATIHDTLTRVCYYFLLNDGDNELYYYSRGFDEKMNAHRTEYFQFPYIRREDIGDTPAWAKDVIMYHIFPDSFASGKRNLSGVGARHDVSEDIVSESRLGGTLKGIEENIDYIADMGFNCIYINPLFTASSYHKYDTIDYMSVDPCLGMKYDLVSLVKKCHENGIKVILDGVFNHCGSNFFAFKDVLKNGSSSKYYDWFYYMPVPVKFSDPPEYEAFAYVKEMPKINTSNKEVIKYFCEVGKYWIREADIDGWRLDVANEINHDFWREFRKAVRSVKKDAFLIAEIWEDANVWLMGDQFDSTMNYTFSYLCKDLFALGKLSITQFDEQINRMLMRYSWNTSLCQMNFLDTHDVARFLSYCEGDVRRLKMAFVYMMTSVGIPSVFYADELEVKGRSEAEYRQAMPWDKLESGDHETHDFFKKVIRIRNTSKALRCGKYKTLLTDDNGVYMFERSIESEIYYVIINISDDEKQCSFLTDDFEGFDEITQTKITSNSVVKPWNALIVKKN